MEDNKKDLENKVVTVVYTFDENGDPVSAETTKVETKTPADNPPDDA